MFGKLNAMHKKNINVIKCYKILTEDFSEIHDEIRNGDFI